MKNILRKSDYDIFRAYIHRLGFINEENLIDSISMDSSQKRTSIQKIETCWLFALGLSSQAHVFNRLNVCNSDG